MERKLDFLVSSNSPHKIEAIKIAAHDLIPGGIEVTGFKTESGVNEQPVDDETFIGAQNRLAQLKLLTPGQVHAVRIAIENGIFTLENNIYEDRAVILFESPDHPVIMHESKGIIFPSEAVEEARKRGFDTTTVGMILAEQNPGVDPTDPHSFLTQGKFSRKSQLSGAIKGVLREYLSKFEE